MELENQRDDFETTLSSEYLCLDGALKFQQLAHDLEDEKQQESVWTNCLDLISLYEGFILEIKGDIIVHYPFDVACGVGLEVLGLSSLSLSNLKVSSS